MQLLDAPESQKLFPPDVLKRAKEYLDATGTGGTGAYTHSQGVELCREHVAKVSESLLTTRLEHTGGRYCLCRLNVFHALCSLLSCDLAHRGTCRSVLSTKYYNSVLVLSKSYCAVSPLCAVSMPFSSTVQH